MPEPPQSRSSSAWWLASALPAIAAVTAGLFYAAGGIARAGELSAAGYRVQDTLALVPIEQILARGLAVVLDPASLVFYGVVAVYGATYFLPRGKFTNEEELRVQRREAADSIEGVLAQLPYSFP